jgi:ligand-binding sensor domain-containing protein/signal transduction histidine kinase
MDTLFSRLRCLLPAAFALLLLFTPEARAASPDPLKRPTDVVRFERLLIEDTAAQSMVYCILQDHQGFLWFGTNGGLNKYDGYQFTHYRHDPENPHSLSHNEIRALFEDQDGMLWIGTNGGGVNAFDPATERFMHYQHAPDKPDSLSHNQVNAIAADQEGRLWIGTGSGLNRLDRESRSFRRPQQAEADSVNLNHTEITVLYTDRAGVLWIGTRGNGLHRFDPAAEQVLPYQPESATADRLSQKTITALYEDHLGILWVGTENNGFYQFDRAAGRVIHYQFDLNDPTTLSHNSVWAICEDQTGALWIATKGGGLNKFDRDTKQFIRYKADDHDPGSLNNTIILSLYEDRSGVLWVGTLGGGLNVFRRYKKHFVHYHSDPNTTNSLPNNMVWALHEDQAGVLWIGTSGGLTKFEPSLQQFTHYQKNPDDPTSLNHNSVRAVYEDHTGWLWVGTYGGGLNAFDRATEQFRPYKKSSRDERSLSHNAVLTIYEDRSNVLWIGTKGGLNRYHRDTDDFTRYTPVKNDPTSLSHRAVTTLYEVRQGALWVGTKAGLNRFDRRTERFVRYAHDPANPAGLRSDEIHALCEDAAGTLWIGTKDGGLHRFDRETQTFTAYTAADGLVSNAIYGILADPFGNLWLSTPQHGLIRFDPDTETFTAFGPEVGVQNHEFHPGASHRGRRSGQLFFGGVKGFNAFYPHLVKTTPNTPPIVFTDFYLFNQTVGISQDGPLQQAISEARQVKLTYQQNVFSFEVAALDYNTPHQNQYAYRIDEVDKAWIELGTDRIVRYTNLSPGEYTLRVKGSNNDGVWNTTGTTLKLLITPIFWESDLFQALLLAAIIAVVIGVSYHRMRWSAQQQRVLRQLVTERTAELEQQKDKLRQSEARYRNLFENAPISLWEEDLSELKTFLEQLQASGTTDVRAYFAQHPEAVEAAVKHIRVLSINQTTLSLYDAVSKEVFFDHLDDILTSGDPDVLTEELTTLAAGRTSFTSQIRYTTITGQQRYALISLFIPPEAEATWAHVPFCLVDITAQKEAETRLMTAHDELKATLDNLKQTQAQLVESDKMAALGQLVAGVAHEIKTPLGAIRASVENISHSLKETLTQLPEFFRAMPNERQRDFFALLDRALQKHTVLSTREDRRIRKQVMQQLDPYHLDDPRKIARMLVSLGVYDQLDSFQPLLQDPACPRILDMACRLAGLQESTHTIAEATERAVKVLTALKRYSRYDRSGQKEQADIVEGIEAVLTLYHHQIKQGIEVIREYAPLPPIWCYPDELNQVWTNLVHNALHAMDQQGTLTITVGRQTAEGNQQEYVVVSVTDTGKGIPENIKAQIFEPFFTTKPAGEGSGLGLDIVKKIVAKHQGRIEVDSVPGHTTFQVWLPLTASE